MHGEAVTLPLLFVSYSMAFVTHCHYFITYYYYIIIYCYYFVTHFTNLLLHLLPSCAIILLLGHRSLINYFLPGKFTALFFTSGGDTAWKIVRGKNSRCVRGGKLQLLSPSKNKCTVLELKGGKISIRSKREQEEYIFVYILVRIFKNPKNTKTRLACSATHRWHVPLLLYARMYTASQSPSLLFLGFSTRT